MHRSAPDLGQVFQTLGRLLPILILCDIIAGTGLADAWQVAVTEDPSLRKASLQFLDQCGHAPFLGLGARVGELSPLVQASLVADADRVWVESRSDVRPHLFVGPADVDGAVLGDVTVVAASVPAPRTVVTVEPLEGVVPVAPRRRAVDDDHVNLSHDSPPYAKTPQACTATVPTMVLMMVTTTWSTFFTVDHLIFFIRKSFFNC